jgi:hypothetical protein
MEVDARVRLVIENAVAASRWRIAARFEGPETARRYRRLADLRSRTAMQLLNKICAEAGQRPASGKFREAKGP